MEGFGCWPENAGVAEAGSGVPGITGPSQELEGSSGVQVAYVSSVLLSNSHLLTGIYSCAASILSSVAQ